MKKIAKILLLIFIFVAVFQSTSTIALSDAAVSKVRIGLYFNDTSKKITTAKPNFSISSEKGISIDTTVSGVKTNLLLTKTNEAINVTKDTNFSVSNSVFTPYIPGKTEPTGTKLGPWHVKIGQTYPDAEAASTYSVTLATYGVTAYPAFDGAWKVYSGNFTDSASANAAISKVITPKIGDESDCTIVQGTSQSIMVYNSKAHPILFYSGKEGLNFSPLPEANPPIFKMFENAKLTYRGTLEARRISGSDMTLVNIIPIENYLYGVVPAEIGGSSPAEALKAQAVAARNYTYVNMGKYKTLGFDLCTTTSSQVYKGYSIETAAVRSAVDATKDMVVKYGGKIAEVFYFASDGGKTEDIKNVWGNSIPYLLSVDDPYENTKSSKYNWEYQITGKKATELLGTKYGVGTVINMKVTKTSATGRATELTIFGTKKNYVFKLEKTRLVFGLNSQKYTISNDADFKAMSSDKKLVVLQAGGKKVLTSSGIKTIAKNSQEITILGAGNKLNTFHANPSEYSFTGSGWGHAVGMSQEGAIGYAKNGWNYINILKHYFTGVTVEKR